MSRYDGKPFLRLLDCYVLDAIDQLDEAQRAVLESLEPQLEKTFGSSGAWQNAVAQQMAFSDEVPDKIRLFWDDYLERARTENRAASPGGFVAEFVATNFPDLGVQ